MPRTLAALAGALAGWLSGAPAPLRLLLFIMTLDYLSGLGAALLGRSKKSPSGALSSKTGFIGLAKKAMILAVVLLAAVLDRFFSGTASADAVTFFYIVNESISVLENAVLIGIPVPERLRRMLDVARKDGKISKRPGSF